MTLEERIENLEEAVGLIAQRLNEYDEAMTPIALAVQILIKEKPQIQRTINELVRLVDPEGYNEAMAEAQETARAKANAN